MNKEKQALDWIPTDYPVIVTDAETKKNHGAVSFIPSKDYWESAHYQRCDARENPMMMLPVMSITTDGLRRLTVTAIPMKDFSREHTSVAEICAANISSILAAVTLLNQGEFEQAQNITADIMSSVAHDAQIVKPDFSAEVQAISNLMIDNLTGDNIFKVFSKDYEKVTDTGRNHHHGAKKLHTLSERDAAILTRLIITKKHKGLAFPALPEPKKSTASYNGNFLDLPPNLPPNLPPGRHAGKGGPYRNN